MAVLPVDSTQFPSAVGQGGEGSGGADDDVVVLNVGQHIGAVVVKLLPGASIKSGA